MKGFNVRRQEVIVAKTIRWEKFDVDRARVAAAVRCPLSVRGRLISLQRAFPLRPKTGGLLWLDDLLRHYRLPA